MAELRCLKEAMLRRSGGDLSAMFFLGYKAPPSTLQFILLFALRNFRAEHARSLRQGL